MADSAGTKDKDTQDGNNKQTSTPGVNQEGDTQTEDVDEEESEMSVAVPAGDWESSGPSRPEAIEVERDSWSNEIDFLMTCISMSVGLGNIYRFPYVAYTNGGGAFLIPYLVVLFLVGRPMYYFELLLGQFSTLGCIQCWEIVPAFKGIGWVMVLSSACTATYYTSVLATAIYYLVASFWPTLPWSKCDPNLYLKDGKPRKDVHCDETLQASADFILHYNANESGQVCSSIGNCKKFEFPGNITLTGGNGSQTELYFKFSVVQQYENIDDGIGAPEWKMTLCLLLSWIIVFAIQAKGATGSGKVAWFTAMFPYVILFTLFGMTCNLEHAGDGMRYFFTPQWDKLLEVNVWFQAVQQCFFSLGMGFGAVVVFGSYNEFRHNLTRDVWIVSFMDTMTSVLAGATIFGILGHLAQGRDISKVVTSGPNIAFASYPAVLPSFGPYPVPQIFSFMFFFMIITLGIGSAVSYCATVCSVLGDEFNNIPRIYITGAVCIFGFLVGLIYVTPGGPFMLLLIDTFGTSFVLYVVVLMEAIAVCWCYGLRNFCNDVEFMLEKKVNWYWKTCWGFVVPVGLSVILGYSFATYEDPQIAGVGFPQSALVIGKLLSTVILSVIPIIAVKIIVTRKTRSWYKKIRASLYPSIVYGPKELDVRTEWLDYKQTVPCRYHPWRVLNKLRGKRSQKKRKHSTDSRALLQLLEIAAKAETHGGPAPSKTEVKKKDEKHLQDTDNNEMPADKQQ